MIPGLEQKEEKLYLALLKHQAMALPVLCRQTKIARSTALLKLRSLEQRGLAQQIHLGKRTQWRAASPRQLLEQAQHAVHATRELLPKLEALQQVGELAQDRHPEVQMYSSSQGVRLVYGLLLKLKKGERIFSVEGTRSVEAKLRLLPESYMVGWQQQFKKRGLILECFITQASVDHLKTKNTALIEAHLGRALVTHILPTDVLDSFVDVFIFGHYIAFIDIQRDIAILIRDVRMHHLFAALLRVLAQTANRIDLNQALKQGK